MDRFEIIIGEQESIKEVYRRIQSEQPGIAKDDLAVAVVEVLCGRIAELEQLIFIGKTKQQALMDHNREAKAGLDEIRLEKLRAKEKLVLYKPITGTEETDKRISRDEKSLKHIMVAFDCDRESALAFLKNPAALPGKPAAVVITLNSHVHEIEVPIVPTENGMPMNPNRLAACKTCEDVLAVDRIDLGECADCEALSAKCSGCGKLLLRSEHERCDNCSKPVNCSACGVELVSTENTNSAGIFCPDCFVLVQQ